MLNPFIDVILTITWFINTALFVWVIMNLLVHFDILNARQPIVARVRMFLDQLFTPILRPIRRYVPTFNGIDLSPIVLILILRFVESAVMHWLYAPTL